MSLIARVCSPHVRVRGWVRVILRQRQYCSETCDTVSADYPVSKKRQEELDTFNRMNALIFDRVLHHNFVLHYLFII